MKKILYFALAFAALGAVSCQQEMELHPVGSKILFSASTEFKNGIETKTIYSGDYTQTSPNYERIQWVANDRIKILYSHGGSTSADYVIDGTTITGTSHAKKSTASISASGAPLEWAEGNSHVFYGLYPYNAGTLTAGSVTGLNIPATQTVIWDATHSKYMPATLNGDGVPTMTNAYMVAYNDMSSDPNGSVSLPFTPVVNAIEFQLKLPDTNPSYTVKKVRFSHGSTAIAGSYNVSITGFANDAVTWSASSSSTTKAIVVDFSDGSASDNPAIPTSNSGTTLDFTILTLPVSISDPVLEIKYSDDHILRLTLTGLTLLPGQKCIVTNRKAGHDHFTYEVTNPANQTITGHDAASFQQINVTSIKRSSADNTHTDPVTWKVQYNDNGTWRDGVPSTHTLSEDHTNNRFTVSLATANTNTTGFASGNPFQAATEILKARPERGSAGSPWDLSTHDWAGNSISQTTANCYVVTAPGVYKIPLYYGNARLNGQDNTSAYSPKDVSAINSAWGSGNTDATQNYYLPAFYNATGEVITSPNIYTDLSHYGTTTLTQAVSLDMDLDIITNCEVKGSGASAYIQFTITKANIKPGNVRLILKGGVNNYFTTDDTWPVLWSWHIWITDKNLAPASGSTVMPFNLGWVDANTTVSNSVDKYTNRTVQLRIAQVDGGSEVRYSSSFTLTQNGDVSAINNPLNGTNPHYQWGRKDPFSFDKSTVQLSHWSDAGPYVYWRGIRVPDVMIKSEKSTTWMDGKAIPLYKITQTPTGDYTLAARTYGPFTSSQKSAIQGVLGNSGWSTKKQVNSNLGTERWFTDYVRNWMITENSIFIPEPMSANDWFQQGVVWAIHPGTILSSTQLSTLSSLCTNAGIASWPSIGITANDYSAFVSACLDDVYYITLSSARTVTSSQKTTLEGQGISSSAFTANYASTESYTTDAERNAGSILHNLWSAALYNENANVTKYKTVYDPCPAGFTVPTKATYNSGTFTYPLTGRRYNNNSGSGTVSVTDNGTKGYYWTDQSCNMSYNTGAKDVITSYTDYDKSYILETTSSTATVKKNIRASAASIRPMVDPRY